MGPWDSALRVAVTWVNTEVGLEGLSVATVLQAIPWLEVVVGVMGMMGGGGRNTLFYFLVIASAMETEAMVLCSHCIGSDYNSRSEGHGS